MQGPTDYGEQQNLLDYDVPMGLQEPLVKQPEEQFDIPGWQTPTHLRPQRSPQMPSQFETHMGMGIAGEMTPPQLEEDPLANLPVTPEFEFDLQFTPEGMTQPGEEYREETIEEIITEDMGSPFLDTSFGLDEFGIDGKQ